MKIRHPVLLSSFGLTFSWFVRAWMSTMSYRHRSLEPELDRKRSTDVGPRIWALWHENLLLPLYQYGQRGLSVLISQHADGTFITGVCRQMGLRVVRGSSTRGGAEAMQALTRAAAHGGIVITPDGPRGPRRKLQPGVVALAAKTGLPLVPLGFGYQRAWRMRSWDRFAIPVPGSLGTCVGGEPIEIPYGASRSQIVASIPMVEERMHFVSDLAESWAATGRFPRDRLQKTYLTTRSA
jgi:lysophospholipid acyltransferase (LPLAT)-like uncharacterized protein